MLYKLTKSDQNEEFVVLKVHVVNFLQNSKNTKKIMEGKISIAALTLLLCLSVSHAGVSYIRWGRTVCPAGQIKLYQGYMVGQHYLGQGNGGNFLCSPDQPKFVRGTAGIQAWAGRLDGVEFEKTPPYSGLFLTDNLPGGELNNQDMLCARCHVPDSSDVFMMPSRDDCYNSGYDVMYKGFLVSEANYGGRHSHEYVCMDESPEGRVGGTGNDNQAVVYPVQLECGSLPCNPYVNGMEATCAVCAY